MEMLKNEAPIPQFAPKETLIPWGAITVDGAIMAPPGGVDTDAGVITEDLITSTELVTIIPILPYPRLKYNWEWYLPDTVNLRFLPALDLNPLLLTTRKLLHKYNPLSIR